MPVLVIAEQLEQQGTHFFNKIENKFLPIILSYVFIPDEIAMVLALLQMNVLTREAQHLDLVPLGKL